MDDLEKYTHFTELSSLCTLSHSILLQTLSHSYFISTNKYLPKIRELVTSWII